MGRPSFLSDESKELIAAKINTRTKSGAGVTLSDFPALVDEELKRVRVSEGGNSRLGSVSPDP